MRVWKKLVATALAALLCAVLALPAAALWEAPGQPLAWEAKAAAEWLMAEVPQPGPGDEVAVLALMRSGHADADSPWVGGYLEKTLALVEGGDATGQKPGRIAWQLLALSAAGVDPNTHAQPLVDALADAEALLQTGAGTVRTALLAFGPGGATPPEGLDTAALARALAESRNADGGFGAEGVSDAAATGRALQALAFYRNDGAVESGVAAGREWLWNNLADYGGYEVEGSPSASATAEAVIALCCLAEDGFEDGFTDDPAEALHVFQNEDGSFAQNPDSEPDPELTALGLLALVSHTRLERGMAPVFRLSDVPRETVAEDAAEDADSGMKLPLIGNLPPLPTWAVVAILLGTVALIVLLAVLVGGGRDMRRRRIRRKRAARVRAARRRREGEATATAPPPAKKDKDGGPIHIPVEYIGRPKESAGDAPAPKEEEQGGPVRIPPPEAFEVDGVEDEG